MFVDDLFFRAFMRDRLCSGHVTVPHRTSIVWASEVHPGFAKVQFLNVRD